MHKETFNALPDALVSAFDFDALLARKELAEASTKNGLPVAEASLASMASRGVGPRFIRFGRAVRYRWGDFLTWAESRSSSGASTAEHRSQRAA